MLQALLEAKTSKQQIRLIVACVNKYPELFPSLLAYTSSNDNQIALRSSWAMSYLLEEHPDWLNENLPAIVQLLLNSTNESMQRGVLRSLQFVKYFPEKEAGLLLDKCLSIVENPKSAIASQAFSLGILQNMAVQYPEIQNELVEVVAFRMHEASPAFKSRGKKILKAFQNPG